MSSSDFESAVNKEFMFLVDKFGFRCTFTSTAMVRYESECVFVAIRYDANRSYELGVEVGRLQDLYNGQERPFSLNEILAHRNLNFGNINSAILASSQSVVESCLKKMASQLLIYGEDYLNNDIFAYRELIEQRERICKNYEIKTKLSFIRNDAKVAWRNRDFKKIIELFDPVKDELNESELKKLNYANKKVN